MHHSSDIGTGDIRRLLFKFSVPAIAGAFINAAYNIVDRLYLARLEDGAGAVVAKEMMAGMTLTLPYMMILASFGTLIGVGTGALISLKLGEGMRRDAERLLGQCVAVKVLFFVTIPVLALIFLDETLVLFGGTEASIPYARDYLRIILYGNIFSHLSFGLSAVMRSEGNATRAMYCMIIGAGLNIVLDPIFIFALGMGIKGAAWATIISMFVSMVYAFAHFLGPRCVVPLRLANVRVFPKLLLPVFAIGLSPFLLQLVASGINVCFNQSFNRWAGDKDAATAAVAAIGVIFAVNQVMLIPLFGLSQGMQPIVGYNYGAKNFLRVRAAFVLSMKVATAFCVLSCFVTIVFAPYIALLFDPNPAQQALIARGLRIFSYTWIIVGAPIVSSTYFQAIGRAYVAIWLSLMRQLILLIPLMLLLPRAFGVDGIWYSVPASDVLSSCVVMTVVAFELRRLHKLEHEVFVAADGA